MPSAWRTALDGVRPTWAVWVWMPARPGPATSISDPDLVGLIRQVLDASPFAGEGYSKVRAPLRREHGVHVSGKRTLRLVRQEGLLAGTPGAVSSRPVATREGTWHDGHPDRHLKLECPRRRDRHEVVPADVADEAVRSGRLLRRQT